ncbi:hypothetical protein CesoFtcFv8_000462 [Champsocephalus esox]|uniref:Uncharacterized protein n=1 Tax=Champsocephalus esox TaxID=159716 RepID=A0AAN8HGG8_9TELE|nr:hypothetical protein CesoFtcFv8_000462 [Champsocephalus esox]
MQRRSRKRSWQRSISRLTQRCVGWTRARSESERRERVHSIMRPVSAHRAHSERLLGLSDSSPPVPRNPPGPPLTYCRLQSRSQQILFCETASKH